MSKNLISALIIGLILMINLILFIYFERIEHATEWAYSGLIGVGMFLSMIGALIMIIVFLVKQFRRKEGPTFVIYLVFFIIFIMNMVSDPFGMQLKNAKKYEACWFGNGTSGRLIIYNDGLFMIHWNGLFRGGTYKGRYVQHGQEFELDYIGRFMDRVGNKLVLKGDTFYNTEGVDGFFLREVYFKIDYCKYDSKKELEEELNRGFQQFQDTGN